ncbi:WecB/TagA/CpsF family glycosyltransferase [Teredinibacter turnerae]|uniref:WecB/TagA/CpsF family glycosyltransferase n=1 Tax=Teredinibacter turnerae TaxID=2426 RepID=UPI0030D2C462
MKIGEDLLPRRLCCVMGLPFDVVTTAAAVTQVEQAMESGEHCFLSTPNLNFVVSSMRDDDFYQSVVESDLIIADGMPIVWVSKLLGINLPERVAGSTLFDELSQRPAEKKMRVFFFGGLPGVAEKAATVLADKFPGAEGCGYFDPGFGSVEDMSTDAIIDTINAANPDFIVVALGAKKGQNWILHNRDRLQAPVVSHLGAVVNFVAGEVSRAPTMVQKLGLEWLWRIKEEPGIWRRYWNDGLALLQLLVNNVLPLYLARNKSGHKQVCQSTFDETDICVKLTLTGAMGSDFSRNLMAEVVGHARPHKPLQLDLSGLEYMDNSFIAFLLLMDCRLQKYHSRLEIIAVSDALAKTFQQQGVAKRFVYAAEA